MYVCIPAMSDDGSSIRWIAGFDPAKEVEEGGGILWHAMIGPGCELELTHFSSLTASTLALNGIYMKKND